MSPKTPPKPNQFPVRQSESVWRLVQWPLNSRPRCFRVKARLRADESTRRGNGKVSASARLDQVPTFRSHRPWTRFEPSNSSASAQRASRPGNCEPSRCLQPDAAFESLMIFSHMTIRFSSARAARFRQARVDHSGQVHFGFFMAGKIACPSGNASRTRVRDPSPEPCQERLSFPAGAFISLRSPR
jgi:hypothetical protein